MTARRRRPDSQGVGPSVGRTVTTQKLRLVISGPAPGSAMTLTTASEAAVFGPDFFQPMG